MYGLTVSLATLALALGLALGSGEAWASSIPPIWTPPPSKPKGLQRVTLAWSGSSAAGFDVYRGGVKLATVGAAGYGDDLGRKGAATYVYRVCAVGSAICSAGVTVTF